ncbi:hypothetical protein [Acidiphilium sp. C61]|uniref:hypothetical protein n=1 Tax=Acidiphilium sp. C61 TaxID=1671485 RepID=UPI00157A2C26|nr:hypothetical protein [Acidiphilium sp. C61]
MRIAIRFGGAVAPGDAVLVQEGFAPPAGARVVGGFAAEAVRRFGHGIGCSCCVPRGAVAAALTRLFLERARGTADGAGDVVIVGDTNGEAAVQAAVEGDVLLRARFFFLPDSGEVSARAGE